MTDMEKHYIEAKKAEITVKHIKDLVENLNVESQKFYSRLTAKIHDDNFGLGENASPIDLMQKIREYFSNNTDMADALSKLNADMKLLLLPDED